MSFLKMDYIYYSILEVLANRPGKKFYIEEIWEDIIDNDYISHDIIDFSLKLVGSMTSANDSYSAIGYDPLDGGEVIKKCKKYKKNAYQIGYDGTYEMIEYKQLREAYLSGYFNANGVYDNDPDEILEANALKSWCCYVQKIFKENLENHLEQIKDVQNMRKAIRNL